MKKKPYNPLSNTVNLLRDKVKALTLSILAMEHQQRRTNAALERLCEERHGSRAEWADFMCLKIDDALFEIWGNTVGPKQGEIK